MTYDPTNVTAIVGTTAYSPDPLDAKAGTLKTKDGQEMEMFWNGTYWHVHFPKSAIETRESFTHEFLAVEREFDAAVSEAVTSWIEDWAETFETWREEDSMK